MWASARSLNVDVVSNACAIFCCVVIAKDTHTLALAKCCLNGHFDKVRGVWIVLTDKPLFVRACYVKIAQNRKFDAIIHFAAFIEVFESMSEPLKYYLNNTANVAKGAKNTQKLTM